VAFVLKVPPPSGPPPEGPAGDGNAPSSGLQEHPAP